MADKQTVENQLGEKKFLTGAEKRRWEHETKPNLVQEKQ